MIIKNHGIKLNYISFKIYIIIGESHNFFLLFFLQLMALTNAEKQRRYREKRDSDPKRRSQYLEKKDLDISKM